VQRWREQLVDYPHALVRLHFCKVSAWQGELQMREGQRCVWQRLPVQLSPVLPGALPVLQWLAQEASTSPDAI
jgi:8-oxo-dGTP diphosphatase